MDLLALLRTTVRTLLRRPGYAALVVATLAVGIGGTTAIFTLVQGVLLRPLPYGDADEIVTFDVKSRVGNYISLSIPDFEDWRNRSRSFSTFGAAAGWTFVRETADGAERVDARVVLGDFFETLRIPAELGRVIPGAETGPGAAPVAVLGHGFWERAFGADPAVLGQAVTLDGQPYTVVGVLPAGAGYPRPDVEVYTPMGVLADGLPWDNRDSSFGTRALARLVPGADVGAAQQDMNRVTSEVDAEEGKPGVTAEVRTLADLLVGNVRRGLLMLMAGVALVLLIAGANVANLALARSEARGAEMAVRRALGAGVRDITRVVVAESALLALLGGGIGIALATAVVGVLPGVLPLQLPGVVAGRIGLNGSVVAFGLGLTALAGLAFTLAPALRASLAVGRLGHGVRALGDRAGRRTRDALVVVQVALSLILLVASGLLLRSLQHLSAVDPGFRAEGVFTARVSGLDSPEEWLAFHDQVHATVAASPDVEKAASTLLVPLSDRSWERRVVPDNATFEVDVAPSVLFNVVSEAYFDVMGIPLLRGRTFQPSDRDDAPLVVVIDETMAERFWPGEDPVGHRLTMQETRSAEDREIQWRTVVGVVPNLRHYELTSPSRVQAYVPMRQALRAAGTGMYIVAKARGDASAVPGLVRATVSRLRPDIPVFEPRMLSDYVADETGQSRALGVTTTLFGVVAALLAALGIFGVLSLSVARRAPELGLRLAVGATPRNVVTMVVGQGMALVAVGTAVGVTASVFTGRALGAVLFEVRPWDGGVYATVVVVLLAVASLAALRPALRAARTQPVEVLKGE
ncbi:MAG TPA: ABC transporter permease [Longimicrobiales bacterium]|nr:ABC transporter permease [Longimicrobiales bacterium]